MCLHMYFLLQLTAVRSSLSLSLSHTHTHLEQLEAAQGSTSPVPKACVLPLQPNVIPDRGWAGSLRIHEARGDSPKGKSRGWL